MQIITALSMDATLLILDCLTFFFFRQIIDLLISVMRPIRISFVSFTLVCISLIRLKSLSFIYFSFIYIYTCIYLYTYIFVACHLLIYPMSAFWGMYLSARINTFNWLIVNNIICKRKDIFLNFCRSYWLL